MSVGARSTFPPRLTLAECLDKHSVEAILSIMGGGPGVIRTPDQRLRVFVSSTLKELAPERRVIRSVIERLALAPVMFELGARPHPPRSLYRAYLEQSDIFVGVYWESYGWVAPGEDVSGLEDEYSLAPDIPMLIYVKRSEQREERLNTLLDRIRDDDRASYVTFGDAEDLGPFVTTDLATLLAERFDEGSGRRSAPPDGTRDVSASPFRRPPIPMTRLIGREAELRQVVDMFAKGARRLVTLTGPGGIGKSRLATAVAGELQATFPDGIAFVDLAPIRKVNLVVSTIATALAIHDTGDAPLRDKLLQALEGRRVLLLIDNVEHVVDAAQELSALLKDSPVSILATTRILLRIQGEQNVPLTPLPPPAAIELFVERARETKPEFDLTDGNAADVAAIIAALDNVPLALELAAARLRVLTPAALAARLDSALPLLVGGARDRPEHQRTLRATIDWSAQLLSDQGRDLLLRLSVFRNGFALDAAEWMCENPATETAMDLVTNLVESSLVQEQDRGSSSWFSMLATVREYAREELERRGNLRECRQRHAAFFSALAARAEPHLTSGDQSVWIERLAEELDDIRGAADHYLSTGQGDAAADLILPLYWFWWSTGRPREAADMALRLGDVEPAVSESTHYRARLYVAGLATLDKPDTSRIPELEQCIAFFERTGDRFSELLSRLSVASLELMQGSPGLRAAELQLKRAESLADELSNKFLASMALLIGGHVPLARGDVTGAIEKFEASLEAAKASGEALSQSAALYQLGWAQLFIGNPGAAKPYFVRQMLISRAVGHEQGLANGLDGMFAVAYTSGEVDRAGRLLGASDELRERRGLLGRAMAPYYEQLLATVTASPAAREFELAREKGRRGDIAQMIDELLSGPPATS